MKGKKSLFTAIILIALGAYCYGANDFKILKTPIVELKTGFSVPTQTSLRNDSPSFCSDLKIDFYSICANAAFNLTSKSTDTVLGFLVKPLSTQYFDLGLGVKYHLYDYFDSFIENDFLFNQKFCFKIKNIIKFCLNTGYDIKLSVVKNNKKVNPIFYQTMLLGLDCFWNINKSVQMYAGVNSMSDFDYSLIGNPFYNLGFNFKLKENFIAGFNYDIKMIDMVAVAETFSEMLLSLYMKVTF